MSISPLQTCFALFSKSMIPCRPAKQPQSAVRFRNEAHGAFVSAPFFSLAAFALLCYDSKKRRRCHDFSVFLP